MTTHFITPCYVRVEDADKRKEICQQLKEMGYVMNFLPKTLGSSTRNSVIVNGRPFYGEYREPSCSLQNHRAGLAKSPEIDGWQFINCGTNTALFLALAGMRSDTDMLQLFIYNEDSIMHDKGDMFVSTYDKCSGTRHRRATAAEIIEHFKTKTK